VLDPLFLTQSPIIGGNEDAKRLLDDLLENYNIMVRPTEKPSDAVKMYLGIKLSQIADIVRFGFMSFVFVINANIFRF
jgi:hypothetical protein